MRLGGECSVALVCIFNSPIRENSMANRKEADLLGEKEVPDSAYYGIHTQRALENFQISNKKVRDIPEFVRGMVQVKKACALANAELGVLPEDIAAAIVEACDEVLEKGRCLEEFPVDLFQGGAGTSTNMNTNEVIANLALEALGYEKGRYDIIHPNDHVNKSQSTNDTYPVGIRLAVYQEVLCLLEELEKLEAALAAKGREFAGMLKMGRTQLQDAVPMSLGEEFQAFASSIQSAKAALAQDAEKLLYVNSGATAIGTGVNTPDGFSQVVAEKLAEVTGLARKNAPDLMEATYDNGDHVLIHSHLKRLAHNLTKICNDLRLLSSGPRAGLNEINLPQMQAGSSIMPAKVNPVIPEVVNQVCFKVIGNDTAVLLAAAAGQLQLNVMEPVILEAMSESFQLLTNACRTLRQRCIEGITANREIMRSYVMNSIGIVTYLNDILGHEKGDLIGKTAAQSGKNIKEVVLELGLLTEEEIDTYLCEEVFLNPKFSGKIYKPGEKGLPPTPSAS